MPSSVSEGVRPSAARMRSYSSAVMLCCASICGVMVTGSGTTAEEALVIVDAFILAQGLRAGWRARCGKTGRKTDSFGRADAQKEGAAQADEQFGCGVAGAAAVANRAKAMRYFGSRRPPKAGMAELADAADSKSAGPCGHGGSTPPPGTMIKHL